MGSRASKRKERVNRWLWAVVDSGVWVLAVFIAAWLRYDLRLEPTLTMPMLWLTVAAVATHVVLGAFLGPYAVGHDRGSFEETYDVGRTVLVTMLVLLTLVFALHLGPMPRSVPFSAPAFAVLGMFAARFIIRSIRMRQTTATAEGKRAIVFGAGEAGRRLTRSLIRDEDSGYYPVALLDDDPAKARLRFEGVKVRGTRDHMVKVAEKHDADTLVIALPQADAQTIRELTELGEEAGLKVLTLPPVRTSSAAGRPCATCATSMSPTCSADVRSTWTWQRLPSRSPASASSSPARAGRSARSCAARSRSSDRPSSSCSTVTSRVSKPPRCRSPATGSSRATSSCWATSASPTHSERRSPAPSRTSSSTPRR